jgi:hypothetical protein
MIKSTINHQHIYFDQDNELLNYSRFEKKFIRVQADVEVCYAQMLYILMDWISSFLS